jgi:WD40 repeat protein
VWETATGRCVATFAEHDSWVRGVRWHPNGLWVITVCEDSALRVFDVASGRLVKSVDGAGEGAFLTCVAVRGAGAGVVASAAASGTALLGASLLGGSGGHGGSGAALAAGGVGAPVIITGGADAVARVWECR